MHLGYDNPNVETSLLLVKYFDAFLGVPSILLDGDTKRRNLYGKAGAFRLTDYGLEYRSLSSVFLKTKTNLNFVWDGIMRVIKAYNLQIPLPPADEVQAAINNSDSVLAKQLIDKYHLTIMPNNKYVGNLIDANFNNVVNPVDELLDRLDRIDNRVLDAAKAVKIIKEEF